MNISRRYFYLLTSTAVLSLAYIPPTLAWSDYFYKKVVESLSGNSATDENGHDSPKLDMHVTNTVAPADKAGAPHKIPFRISVDGETVDESLAPAGLLAPGEPRAGTADRERLTDVGLSAVDIQVKYDGLDVKPMLNVSTMPVERTYQAGEEVRFLATANYPAFIHHAEIRIFRLEDTARPVDVIPIPINGAASWMMPSEGEGEFSYVLRVCDGAGRFDETVPLTIARSGYNLQRHVAAEAVAPGWGEDRTAFRNIPVHGGAVTVHGEHVPPGYLVHVMGEAIPVDPNQAFLVQRILPPGAHAVEVGLEGSIEIRRTLLQPRYLHSRQRMVLCGSCRHHHRQAHGRRYDRGRTSGRV